VIPGEKLGFCWRTGEGKEEGDGADRRARTVSEGGRAFCGREASGRRQAAVWAVRSWAKREAMGCCAKQAGVERARSRVGREKRGVRFAGWAAGMGWACRDLG
jgi:hypothetical protein